MHALFCVSLSLWATSALMIRIPIQGKVELRIPTEYTYTIPTRLVVKDIIACAIEFLYSRPGPPLLAFMYEPRFGACIMYNVQRKSKEEARPFWVTFQWGCLSLHHGTLFYGTIPVSLCKTWAAVTWFRKGIKPYIIVLDVSLSFLHEKIKSKSLSTKCVILIFTYGKVVFRVVFISWLSNQFRINGNVRKHAWDVDENTN